MAKAIFYFESELNHFLPPHQHGVSFTHSFKGNPSIKDTIEALGVPHTEVNVILVNGESVNFAYLLQAQDQVRVYSVSHLPEIDSKSLIQLQPPLSGKPSFVLDVHLGKLASWLRLLGFDTLYRNDYEDAELAQISATESRILLSRDKGLLMRKQVIYGYYVRETDPETQIIEVLTRFNLFAVCKPGQRCIPCNGILETVEKKIIIDQIPTQTREQINEFYRCKNCGKIYWRGSHYQKIQQFVKKILG